MKHSLLFFIAFILMNISKSNAQTNILVTNPVANQILKGNYNPIVYLPTITQKNPIAITNSINTRVSADSLKFYIEKLATFKNRNSGSDTISQITGIGAARRWVNSKFDEFSAKNENRLITGYLQWDQNICSATQHRNMMAVLPGSDTSDKSIIIIQGHIDSRCAGVCDTACIAEGIEDNASGTALVMELARVMAQFSFKNTVVFTALIGEEQGLYGGNAFALFCKQNNIPVKGVLNNDVIGGIICGQTASQPGCQAQNDIDSTQVRLFSAGGFNSLHKGLSRFVKLQYHEVLQPMVSVPMTISIMSPEDRTGRGGDHIPFRQQGFTAIRFTSANEHGDASNGPTYVDRQHTSSDILGFDTDNDLIIDSFFVDFNYLARNAVINGNAAVMMGLGPKTPTFTGVMISPTQLEISILTQQNYGSYRVGIRTLTNDFDSVYTIYRVKDTINLNIASVYYISTASVDSFGTESLFSNEIFLRPTTTSNLSFKKDIELLQNKPNPADEQTIISVLVNNPKSIKNAKISIVDIQGKLVKEIPVSLIQGINEILYDHGYNVSGIYFYSLILNGVVVDKKKMVFTN